MAVAEHLKTVDFDGSVVITFDSHTQMVTNWWHFSGHDGSWGAKELSSIAQQLASHTAEQLKTDINNPNGRPVNIQTPRVARLTSAPSPKYILLYGLGVALKKNSKRRLWFRCDWMHQQFGLSLFWHDGISLLVGPLFFAAYTR